MAYKYVTSDIDAIHSMELFVQEYLRGGAQAEGILKWLSSYMKSPFDPYCHNANTKCTMPTYRRRPDVLVQVTSQHHNWPVPLVVIEIIGTKDLWGHAVEEFPGYVETLYTLSMVPIAYYLQVGYAQAKLYTLKRIPEENRIDIQYTILPWNSGNSKTGFADQLHKVVDVMIHVLVRAMQYVPVAKAAQQDYYSMTKEFTDLLNPLTRAVICSDCWYIQSLDELRQRFNDNSMIERQNLGGGDAGTGGGDDGGGEEGDGGGDDDDDGDGDDRGGQTVFPHDLQVQRPLRTYRRNRRNPRFTRSRDAAMVLRQASRRTPMKEAEHGQFLQSLSPSIRTHISNTPSFQTGPHAEIPIIDISDVTDSNGSSEQMISFFRRTRVATAIVRQRSENVRRFLNFNAPTSSQFRQEQQQQTGEQEPPQAGTSGEFALQDEPRHQSRRGKSSKRSKPKKTTSRTATTPAGQPRPTPAVGQEQEQLPTQEQQQQPPPPQPGQAEEQEQPLPTQEGHQRRQRRLRPCPRPTNRFSSPRPKKRKK